MMDKPWRDDLTRLFLIENGTAKFLRGTHVQTVLWPKHGEPLGRVILKGLMPHAKEILDFPEGATLSLTHGFCGDPYVHYQNDEIMRLNDCHVVRKWIVRMGSDTGVGEEIYLRILLDCDIEVAS